LKEALRSESWDELAGGVTRLAANMGGVPIPKRLPTPRPWSGALAQAGPQLEGL
jgi:hypothetical protein